MVELFGNCFPLIDEIDEGVLIKQRTLYRCSRCGWEFSWVRGCPMTAILREHEASHAAAV